ncbi:trypsin-like serine protease, partial [Kitasatospora sp. NPDC093558]|uniref:trypsin-like serine protease n=1 Tax=Kitasatospora sp. NPDC093558 TaxID=3155201 RepID=UPI003423E3D4
MATFSSPATAAAPALSAPVEDFSYPDAAKILADRGITLKSGDGHIVLADCASGPGLVHLYSRVLNPSEVCFRITDRTASLSMEIPQVYLIKGDDHAVKATLNTEGKVTSVDLDKNTWKAVGEGTATNATTLLQLNATDGPAASTASAFPAIGRITVGQPGEPAAHGCTGTLVAAQWVLTTKSCLGILPSDPPQPASWFRNRQSTATFGAHSLTVTGWTTQPDRDVALARLASPIADITPAAIGTAPATVGQSV